MEGFTGQGRYFLSLFKNSYIVFKFVPQPERSKMSSSKTEKLKKKITNVTVKLNYKSAVMVNLKGQKAHRTHPICKEFKEFKYFRMREETLM